MDFECVYSKCPFHFIVLFINQPYTFSLLEAAVLIKYIVFALIDYSNVSLPHFIEERESTTEWRSLNKSVYVYTNTV